MTHHTGDTGKRITRSQTGTQIQPPDRLNYLFLRLKKGRCGVNLSNMHTDFVCNLLSVYVFVSLYCSDV